MSKGRMSITDELREWTRNYTVNCSDTRIALVAIASRIDAEHEQQMAERRRSCVFYDAERNYCKVHDEGDMAELGYVRLPVDTDGVPIRIGDVMEVGNGRRDEVRFLTLNENGWAFNEKGWVPNWSHHHAPTVEDVLDEFAHVGIRIAAKHGIKAGEIDFYADEDAIAEFAAKLALRGDE